MSADGHIPRKGRIYSHSPRELTAWKRCRRLWRWLYPEGHRHDEAPTASAQRGIDLHRIIAEAITGHPALTEHPVAMAALEVLGDELTQTHVEILAGEPDGGSLWSGRIDALTPSRVIDWKTITSEYGPTGRRPGLQGEIYCRLSGRRCATVVEIDEYGDWDASEEVYDEEPSAELIRATIGVEWGWEHQDECRGALCAWCDGCPAAAECQDKKRRQVMDETLKSMWDRLPYERQAVILTGLGASSFAALEKRAETPSGERMVRAVIGDQLADAESGAPMAGAKPTKKKAPKAEPEPAPAAAEAAIHEQHQAAVQAAAEKCEAAIAATPAPEQQRANIVANAALLSSDAPMWGPGAAPASAVVEAPAPAPAVAAPDPSADPLRDTIAEALAVRLVDVPAAEWPALSSQVREAVADWVAAARRDRWSTARTEERVRLLVQRIVPLTEHAVCAVVEAPDVTIADLAALAALV